MHYWTIVLSVTTENTRRKNAGLPAKTYARCVVVVMRLVDQGIAAGQATDGRLPRVESFEVAAYHLSHEPSIRSGAFPSLYDVLVQMRNTLLSDVGPG